MKERPVQYGDLLGARTDTPTDEASRTELHKANLSWSIDRHTLIPTPAFLILRNPYSDISSCHLLPILCICGKLQLELRLEKTIILYDVLQTFTLPLNQLHKIFGGLRWSSPTKNFVENYPARTFNEPQGWHSTEKSHRFFKTGQKNSLRQNFFLFSSYRSIRPKTAIRIKTK